MTSQPQISVIICVYTAMRWDDICEAVTSVQEQTLKPLEIILVVDHNPMLLVACRAAFPAARVIENSCAQGLSGGRNTGITEARGELLAFLDDDAVAAPDWLTKLSKHFEQSDVLGVTSAVLPIWQGVEPDWFPQEFMWTVGCMRRDRSRGVQEIRNVQGGAAMLRRDLFIKTGGFSSLLGRKGSKIPLSCEETELCIRAKAAYPEGRFLYDPATSIGHKVTGNRAKIGYFIKRCYAEGVSKALLTRLLNSNQTLSVERDYVLHELVAGFLREVNSIFRRLDPGGLKRASAIILGLVSAGAGFLIGKLREDSEQDAPQTVEN